MIVIKTNKYPTYYSNLSKYKNKKCLKINNKLYYNINYNKIKKGGNFFKFDLFTLGKISFERSCRLPNIE